MDKRITFIFDVLTRLAGIALGPLGISNNTVKIRCIAVPVSIYVCCMRVCVCVWTWVLRAFHVCRALYTIELAVTHPYSILASCIGECGCVALNTIRWWPCQSEWNGKSWDRWRRYMAIQLQQLQTMLWTATADPAPTHSERERERENNGIWHSLWDRLTVHGTGLIPSLNSRETFSVCYSAINTANNIHIYISATDILEMLRWYAR